MAQRNYKDIVKDIKDGNPAPVYLLMGEESWYIDQLVQLIESTVIPEDDRDFNLNVYYGNDADMETVVACAQQFPVMADRKLVILKEAQTASQAKTALEKLAPYVARANDSTVLVVAFKGDNLNATSKLMKAATANKEVVVFKSPMLKDWQLPATIKDYLTARRVGIEDKAVALLCDYIGLPLSKLFGEVNKLLQIKGGKAGSRITCEDIEKNIGISKDFNNFELQSALIARDYPKALRIVNYFEKNSKANPSVLTTATLLTFFSRLVMSHYAADKSDQGLMAVNGLKVPFQLRDIRAGMKSFNPRQAVNAIHHLREFDAKSKGVGSFQKEYDLLRELIFKILT